MRRRFRVTIVSWFLNRTMPRRNIAGALCFRSWGDDEALAGYDRALALKPDYADAFNNRGNRLRGSEEVSVVWS